APSKTIAQLANEVIAGKHGTGEARKKALGSQYNAVQKRVNEILGAKSSKPTNKPRPKKKTLHLPKSVKTWRVYKPNGPYTVGNEIHLLTPSAFKNGITYDILEEKGGHVYIINTQVKGRVAIYAGPDTAAVIK